MKRLLVSVVVSTFAVSAFAQFGNAAPTGGWNVVPPSPAPTGIGGPAAGQWARLSGLARDGIIEGALTDLPGAGLDDSVRTPTEAAYETLSRAGIVIDRASDLLPDQAQQYRSYLKMMNIVMSGGAPAPDGKRATASDWFALMNAQATCMAEWEAQARAALG
mgnify:CR=1 FL=1